MSSPMLPRRLFLLALPLLALPPALAADDPAPSLVGTWTWTWKDGEGKTHRHVLDVESKGNALVGRERMDDGPAVKASDLKVDGKRVRYFVVRGDNTITYDGKFGDADTINGMVSVAHQGTNDEFAWTARRERK